MQTTHPHPFLRSRSGCKHPASTNTDTQRDLHAKNLNEKNEQMFQNVPKNKTKRQPNAEGCANTESQCVCSPPGTMMTNHKQPGCQFHVTLCYSCQPMSPSLIQTHCQDFYINSNNVSLGQKSFDGAIIKPYISKQSPVTELHWAPTSPQVPTTVSTHMQNSLIKQAFRSFVVTSELWCLLFLKVIFLLLFSSSTLQELVTFSK